LTAKTALGLSGQTQPTVLPSIQFFIVLAGSVSVAKTLHGSSRREEITGPRGWGSSASPSFPGKFYGLFPSFF
jgi:hypothetical protein